MRIIMGCAFGAGSSAYMIKQWKDGKLIDIPLGQTIKEVMFGVFLKVFRWDFIIHPITYLFNYRPSDRETVKNLNIIRQYAADLVKERRE
mmetsp:Transcript_9766/g.9550  ORF Transcript_9766/g.9550 Transcript_9766/m.9550 type:complete len:90 (-) Transcript_9766:426-695(-)